MTRTLLEIEINARIPYDGGAAPFQTGDRVGEFLIRDVSIDIDYIERVGHRKPVPVPVAWDIRAEAYLADSSTIPLRSAEKFIEDHYRLNPLLQGEWEVAIRKVSR